MTAGPCGAGGAEPGYPPPPRDLTKPLTNLNQVVDIVLPRLGLPDWTVTLVVGLCVLGFPAAVVLAHQKYAKLLAEVLDFAGLS